MASIRLRTDEPAEFPPVCVCCGETATEYRRRWFVWTPGLGVVFAFLGSWRNWRVTLNVPFCHAHRHYFTKRWLPMLLIGLVVVGSAVSMYITTDIRQGKEAARDLERILIPSVLGVLALLGIVGFFLKLKGLRVTDVTGDEFTLSGVCDEFAAAVEHQNEPPPMVEAVDDGPPLVTAADGSAPMVRAARRGSQAPFVEPAPRRSPWLPIILILFLMLAGFGSLIAWWVGAFRSNDKSGIHLSNARITQRMGLLAKVRVDCKAKDVDDKAQYYWVIRNGGTKVMEQLVTAERLRTNTPLEGTAGIVPIPGLGEIDTLIEIQRPGKPREPASNVIRVEK